MESKRPQIFGIAVAIFLLDQLTKWWVIQRLPLHDHIIIIPNIFQIAHIQNPGAAFGIFADSSVWWKPLLLMVFAGIALLVVTVLLWKSSDRWSLSAVSLTCILGGAAGNLVDRLRHGHVTDFLYFHWGPHFWPAFNIADSAIVIGAALLMLEILFPHKFGPKPAATQASD